MRGYFIKKVGSSRKGPRIWLQGDEVAKAGLAKFCLNPRPFGRGCKRKARSATTPAWPDSAHTPLGFQ